MEIYELILQPCVVCCICYCLSSVLSVLSRVWSGVLKWSEDPRNTDLRMNIDLEFRPNEYDLTKSEYV